MKWRERGPDVRIKSKKDYIRCQPKAGSCFKNKKLLFTAVMLLQVVTSLGQGVPSYVTKNELVDYLPFNGSQPTYYQNFRHRDPNH
jgi:hypothetical protein